MDATRQKAYAVNSWHGSDVIVAAAEPRLYSTTEEIGDERTSLVGSSHPVLDCMHSAGGKYGQQEQTCSKAR